MPLRSQLRALVALLGSKILPCHGFPIAITNPTAVMLPSCTTPLALAPQQLGSFETLNVAINELPGRMVVLEDLVTSTSLEPVEFEEAWMWQKFLMQEHLARLSSSANEGQGLCQFLSEEQAKEILHTDDDGSFVKGGRDTIFLLEHNPIYTLGTGSDEKFITGINPTVPVVRMDRGGEVTYHGPGQLVVYPVLDLRLYKQDIHWYMRALEESVLVALRNCGVVNAERQDDTTGIWVDNHKVAAIGVKCRKWITMHGLAVNIEPTSLGNFKGIVPCGLEGRKVGCVNQFLQKRDPLTVREFSVYMKEALEQVLQIELHTRTRERFPKI